MKVADIITESNQYAASDEFLEALRLHTEGGIGAAGIATLEAEMPVLAKSYAVYRGIGFPSSSWDAAAAHYGFDFRNGGRITSGQMMSCTIDLDRAWQFVAERTQIGPEAVYVLFGITTKPGARGVVVDDWLTDNYHDEDEVILGASAFNVVEKELYDANDYELGMLEDSDLVPQTGWDFCGQIFAEDPYAELWLVKLEQT